MMLRRLGARLTPLLTSRPVRPTGLVRPLCARAPTASPPIHELEVVETVESLSVSDFRQIPAGGASSFAIGEFGASSSEMQRFWVGRGVADEELLQLLSQRAVTDGGVWCDPPTLAARLDALAKIIPLRPKQHAEMLRWAGHALTVRSDTIRLKLESLSRVLPRGDVLDMVARCPRLLNRSPAALEKRVAAVKAALPRSDMAELIAECPDLLEISPGELDARATALRESYMAETIATWRAQKAQRMLRVTAKRLRRLRILEGLNPGLRVTLPDRKILRMRERSWQLNFEQKKLSRWRGGRTVRPKPEPRNLSPLMGNEVPRTGNALAWGQRFAALQQSKG